MTMFVYVFLAVAALAAVLFVAGCTSSKTTQTVSMGATTGHAEGYTCPLTGEQLPCPKCCPLNNDQ